MIEKRERKSLWLLGKIVYLSGNYSLTMMLFSYSF